MWEGVQVVINIDFVGQLSNHLSDCIYLVKLAIEQLVNCEEYVLIEF